MWTRDWKGASTNFLEAVGIEWNCACPKTEPKRETSNTLQLPKHAKTIKKNINTGESRHILRKLRSRCEVCPRPLRIIAVAGGSTGMAARHTRR